MSNTTKQLSGFAGMVFVLVILIAANMLAGQLRWRADLTEEKLYTLSDGTRNLLAKLEQPVTLKFFFSSSFAGMPVGLKLHARQVEDLLHEFKIAAKGNLLVETIDPKPDSDAEDAALRYGIAGQQTALFGPNVYCGLAAVSGATEGVLPAMDPNAESLLEYNIIRLIYRVVHPERPTVGVMSSLDVMGSEPLDFGLPTQPTDEPWLAIQEIQQDYDLQRVALSADTIPAAIDTLILVHPKDLSDRTSFAIDQFVLRGGRLMVFVDPLCVADLENSPQQPFARPEIASDLPRLFKAWGVTYDPTQVIADMKAVSRLRGMNNQIEESPVFLTLREQNANHDDIVTAELGALMLPFAGALSATATDTLTVTPLITSSDMAGTVSAMMAQMGGAAINRDFK
ncbi:MAG: GldG family protein, partial [Verrucomicrobia bacterium]|nr:GldG family protein [Verrucomicrobiota bacterium]